jgi:hypothetical protein
VAEAADLEADYRKMVPIRKDQVSEGKGTKIERLNQPQNESK